MKTTADIEGKEEEILEEIKRIEKKREKIKEKKKEAYRKIQNELTEEEKEELKYGLKSKKGIELTAKHLLEDYINYCSGEPSKRIVFAKPDTKIIEARKQGLCDCLTDTFNNTIPDLPKGEKTQTRVVYKEIIRQFNNMKDNKELKGCTKSLIKI